MNHSVPPEQIPRIHLLPHVIQAGVVAVGDDGLCLFGLHALHHPLYRALAEVVTVRFHGLLGFIDNDYQFIKQMILFCQEACKSIL